MNSPRQIFGALLTLSLCAACRGGAPVGAPATFVGRDKCAPCHATELALFKGSDHDRAMDSATDATVLGNFNNATLTQGEVTSTFYRKEGGYFVRTESEEGVLKEYRVSYTFGVYPLQQYLVAFPGGRYQVLPLCWDSRPAESGGQRWFHLYAEERIAPADELFWTRASQNWNYQCAECHSTDLRKHYDSDTRTYATSWSEIDVSCEACHGPGSRHVAWAQAEDKDDSLKWPHRALEVRLERRDEVQWQIGQGDSIAHRTGPPRGTSQVDLCARCHSRRSTLSEYVPGKSLLETHHPALLESPLYYPDGQIREEVYEYGSFLQSKMYKAGVVCSDCHNPHSGKLQAEGDALCQRCHAASTYAVPAHHFHKPESEGARCISCHMPEQTFMVVDARADHSLRVPRPDLSVKLGVPNACNQCHHDRSAEWAARQVEAWYGPPQTHPFAETFARADLGDPRTAPRLAALAADTGTPGIVRASALQLYSHLVPGDADVVRGAATSTDPLVRLAAVGASARLFPDTRKDVLWQLITDSLLLIRTLAARSFAEFPHPAEATDRTRLFDTALAEYVRSQLYNADFPSYWLNVSNLYIDMRDTARTRQALESALALDSTFTPAYVNLADLYRERGFDAECRKVLETALRIRPTDAGVNHALGLLLVRSGLHAQALTYLGQAHESAPDDTRYAYVYAAGLVSQNKMQESLECAEAGLRHHPFDRGLLELVVQVQIQMGHREAALKALQLLRAMYPDSEAYQRMEASLSGS